jgi:DNA-binding XRE family transcriptional regulator
MRRMPARGALPSIGGVTEQREELLAIQKRRQQIAAQSAEPPAAAVATGHVCPVPPRPLRRDAMTSYRKWDRDGYIERVGGIEEAERRRKALIGRQSGFRLAEERKRRGLTQAQLAQAMGVTPGRVSQIERGAGSPIHAVARYVEALGGRLDLIASFGDHTLTVATTDAA